METDIRAGERETERGARRMLPWLLLAFTVILDAAAAALLLANQQGPARESVPALSGDLLYLFSSAIGAALGAVIVARRPRNPIGWIILAVSLIQGANDAFAFYSAYGLMTRPGSLPGAIIAAWLAQWSWTPVFAGVLWAILLYPTGQMLSPRWRIVGWAGTIVVGALLLSAALTSKMYIGGNPPLELANPFGMIDTKNILLPILLPGIFLLVQIILFVALLSLLIRFRRARGDERQQLKWFTYGVVVALVMEAGAGAVLSDWAQAVQNLAFLMLPLSIGLAILKYRLYDIDIIIRRTLVYGALTAILAVVYFGGVVFLQGLFRALTGQSSDVAIVLSTLAIAALFLPLRSRIQQVIDRRFYRRKYDAARVLESFGTAVRDEVDLTQLTDELLAVVEGTMQPATVSLWLREGEGKK